MADRQKLSPVVRAGLASVVVVLLLSAGFAMWHDRPPPPSYEATFVPTAQSGGIASSRLGASFSPNLVHTALEPVHRLKPDSQLVAALPPTPGNRALLAAHVETVLQTIGEKLDIPPAQRPHYRDLLDDMYQSWLRQRVPENQVVTLLRAERLKRTQLAKSGGTVASNEATNLAAVALVPYLQEAGLCSGDPWSDSGLVCNYTDREPGGAHLTGNVRRSGETQPVALKEVPQDSTLARILAAARNPQQNLLPAQQRLSLLDRAQKTAKHWVGQLCDAIIPVANAQTWNTTPGDFDLQNCTVQIPTQATTQVIKLDPYALGLILFQETVGRISDPGAPDSPILNALTATFISNWVAETQRAVDESISKQGNRSADQEARNACRNQSGQAYADCYGRVYANDITATVGNLYGLSLLTQYVKYYATTLATRSASDPTSPFLPWAGTSLLLATAQVDVYGEVYQLSTVQYAALDADQVFVLFPFGFTCAADQCGNVGQCAVLADNAISCMQHIAELKNWDLRPQGGYVIHSINTCTVQALPYTGRLPYLAIRLNEATTGKSGLPNDVTFRSAYQNGFAPNHCDVTQDGNANGFNAGNPVNKSLHLAKQTTWHACPLANITSGPINPTPPLGATGTLGTLAGGRPREQIPVWVWSMNKVTSSLSDYTTIFAGLASTKAAYNAAYVLPANNLVLPNCGLSRNFNGVVTVSGDTYWAWHGAANEAPKASAEMTFAAGAAAGLQFRELYNNSKDPAAPERWTGYVAAAGAVGATFNADKAYDCNVYPISTSVLCAGGSDAYVTASRGMHPMPEVNIVLADTLDHSLIGCYDDKGVSQSPQLYAFGGSVAGGKPEDNNQLPFTVERRGKLNAAASVNYATELGSGQPENATPGADYTPVSGTLHFGAGEDRKTINVPVIGNNTSESSKKVYLRLSNSSGAELPGNPISTGTIIGDDGSTSQ